MSLKVLQGSGFSINARQHLKGESPVSSREPEVCLRDYLVSALNDALIHLLCIREAEGW